jgi:hypothetical protein
LEDKRLHSRVPIDVTMVCEGPTVKRFEAHGKDISIGGMFLESSELPVFGTALSIVGRLPGAKKDVSLPAVVRWTKPGGFGVQFGLLGALETHLISELMKAG